MRPSEFLSFEILERVILFTFGAVFAKLICEGHLEAAAMVSFAALSTAALCVMANMKRQAAFYKLYKDLQLLGIRAQRDE